MKLLVNDRGNSLLELLLFTPVFLLFLFTSLDAGYTFVDRGVFFDSVRSGVSAEVSALRNVRLLSIDDSDRRALIVDDSEMDTVLSELAEKIAESISSYRGIEDASAQDQFSLRLSFLELEIDQSTGALLSVSRASDFFQFPTSGGFSLPSYESSFGPKSYEDFISESLPLSEEVSNYAFPLPRRIESPDIQYLPSSLLLYVEASGAPRGISPQFVEWVTGRKYVLFEQLLFPIRYQFQ